MGEYTIIHHNTIAFQLETQIKLISLGLMHHNKLEIL